MTIPYKATLGNKKLNDFMYHGQRGRILQLLRQQDFVPTAQLRLFSYQYNARIFELREKGYEIESVTKEGKCGFRMV